MQYNFVDFVKNINLYAILDGLLLLAILVIMITFFVYKRNVKMFIFLIAAIVLEVLVMVLSELNGGTILVVSKYILHYAVIFNLIVTAVVYQNDFKNIFQKISTSKSADTHTSDDDLRDATAEILTACQDMAKQDVGAIIIIDTPGDIHENILDTGTRLGAVISAGLLESIFNTKAPLHDGAVIVRGNKIVAAGCFLTLTQRNVNKEMGTRHRAAIGITEETDVLSIVVSEETGIISVVKHGEIKRYMTMDKLKDEIEEAYGISPTALARRAEQNSKKKRFGRKDRFDI
ncbi:MAG: DNA integrity scanning protein DisA nucleotide-binding domain protein [Clostridia bacterium]|nr:DNA integrity scanning protein DisA nucleotide-binding domain protein [Clostridia bacterium]